MHNDVDVVQQGAGVEEAVPHALPRLSFGIATFPDDGLLADQLIAKADERMYADKVRARGRLG